jgi:hypothetical protein
MGPMYSQNSSDTSQCWNLLLWESWCSQEMGTLPRLPSTTSPLFCALPLSLPPPLPQNNSDHFPPTWNQPALCLISVPCWGVTSRVTPHCSSVLKKASGWILKALFFIPQALIEHWLCTRHSSKPWRHSNDHTRWKLSLRDLELQK